MTAAAPTAAEAPRARRAGAAAAALDIDGVAAIGVERWRESYSWPVSDAEFDGIAEAIRNAYLDAMTELSGRGRGLLTADLHFPAFVLQHLHLAAASDRLSQASSGVPYGRRIAEHLTPDWTALGSAFASPARRPSRPGLWARSAAKSWLLNKDVAWPRRVAACFGQARVWALGSRSPLRAAYQKQAGIACRFLTIDDLRPAAAAPLDAAVETAVRGALDRIDAASRKLLAVSLDTANARRAWMRRLSDLNAVMAAVDAIAKLPETLLLTNAGQPAYRAAALAMRARGVEVVGFHHGNDMGAQPTAAVNIVELLPVDRFVVPSGACLRWREDGYGRSRVAQLSRVAFERLPLPHYAQWLDATRREPAPQAIETVMIVGFPPNWIRYPDLAAHWSLTQLDTEIALVAALREGGFRVLYKAHPEFEQQTRELFSGMPCEFVGDRLETCWRLADAFVFPRISSTSFGFALCTNRPVVLLDVDSQHWREEARALLARRCLMVPASVDAGMRLRFDKAALISALKRPREPIDFSFVEQAMCA
jgi:hypothetical protein